MGVKIHVLVLVWLSAVSVAGMAQSSRELEKLHDFYGYTLGDLKSKVVTDPSKWLIMPSYPNEQECQSYFQVLSNQTFYSVQLFFCNDTLGRIVFMTLEEKKIIQGISQTLDSRFGLGRNYGKGSKVHLKWMSNSKELDFTVIISGLLDLQSAAFKRKCLLIAGKK